MPLTVGDRARIRVHIIRNTRLVRDRETNRVEFVFNVVRKAKLLFNFIKSSVIIKIINECKCIINYPVVDKRDNFIVRVSQEVVYGSASAFTTESSFVCRLIVRCARVLGIVNPERVGIAHLNPIRTSNSEWRANCRTYLKDIFFRFCIFQLELNKRI